MSSQRYLRMSLRAPWLRAVLFLLVAAAFLAYRIGPGLRGRRVCMVLVDGRPVTVVKTRQQAEKLLDQIKRAHGPAEGVEFAQKVSFRLVSASRHPVKGEKEARAALSRRLTPVIEGEAILVNGEPLIALPTRAEAAKTLALIQQEFAPKGRGFTVVFKEKIEVKKERVPADRYAQTAEEAVKKVAAESKPVTIHTVRAGETAWQLARDAGIPLRALASANPDKDISNLRVGEHIKIPGRGGGITVIATTVIQEPVGEGNERRLQLTRMTYENGVLVGREVIGYRLMPGAGNTSPRRKSETPKKPKEEYHFDWP